MTRWIGHTELSVEKEKSKRTLIYYAYPEGTKYGYFSSTTREPWIKFLKEANEREGHTFTEQDLYPNLNIR